MSKDRDTFVVENMLGEVIRVDISGPRRFFLQRDEDNTGVSGTGVVAEGIEFTDGVVALRWMVPAGNEGSGNPTSVVFHDNGIESVEKIHGHQGRTRIVFID